MVHAFSGRCAPSHPQSCAHVARASRKIAKRGNRFVTVTSHGVRRCPRSTSWKRRSKVDKGVHGWAEYYKPTEVLPEVMLDHPEKLPQP